MPTLLAREVQLLCSTGRRNQNCRRSVCRRHGYCVPPRDEAHESVFRCPFDDEDAWSQRVGVVGKVVERLKKIVETRQGARGLPSPFAPPSAPDHLDLTKPLDVAALRAQQQKDEE